MVYGQEPSDDSSNDFQKQVSPGEIVDVKLLEANLPSIRQALQNLGYENNNIPRVQISVDSVTFTDGSTWAGNEILYPDPSNPNRKINPRLQKSSELPGNSSVLLFRRRALTASARLRFSTPGKLFYTGHGCFKTPSFLAKLSSSPQKPMVVKPTAPVVLTSKTFLMTVSGYLDSVTHEKRYRVCCVRKATARFAHPTPSATLSANLVVRRLLARSHAKARGSTGTLSLPPVTTIVIRVPVLTRENGALTFADA